MPAQGSADKMSVRMRELKPEQRRSSFNEVSLGFTEQEAVREASRCLQCKNPPCVKGCPVNIPIPAFIQKIKEGLFGEALSVIRTKNSLPGVCGRVCPQEDQCQKVCLLSRRHNPINIAGLERFAYDAGQESSASFVADKKPGKGRVAVIGAGPGGLTASADLALMGYDVTLFEALHKAGGVLTYGIPEFRLPKDIVEREIDFIRQLGVDIRLNAVIGTTHTVRELMDEGYQALYLSTGAGAATFLNIPGENLPEVLSANELLTRVNLMKAYDFPSYATPVEVLSPAVVIGGGNVAIDAARTALRLGCEEVFVLYRRTREEMPARAIEIEHAKEEGICFRYLTQPSGIIDKKNHVNGVICLAVRLGDKDSSGRPRPVVVEGSQHTAPARTVIIAVGTHPNPIITRNTPGIAVTEKGTIIADESGKTTIKRVWAGGDAVSGSATVINAMGNARCAARDIHRFLQDNTV